MIKFFGRIRYNLMKQNKSTRYFKYAFGEIVLVVIGILLALQINNWNEERKNQKFESRIIELIDNNLVQDSTELADELKYSVRANQSTNKLLELVSKGIYNDTLNYLLGDIIQFQRFKSQTSAFEVLKSKGIDNISDNDLQLALISYYDQILFKTYQAMSDVEKSFNVDWVPVIKQEFSDFKWRTYAVPRNPETYFKNPSTTVLFKLFQENREGQIGRIKSAIDKITEIRTLIKEVKG